MKNLIFVIALFCSQSTFCIKLNLNNVIEQIKKHKILHADIVLKQAILETGWFTSYNARERNNLFGFWNSASKKYMTFESWQDSIKYYQMWQKKHYKGGDYYEFLEDIGYATDPKYTWKLQRINI